MLLKYISNLMCWQTLYFFIKIHSFRSICEQKLNFALESKFAWISIEYQRGTKNINRIYQSGQNLKGSEINAKYGL